MIWSVLLVLLQGGGDPASSLPRGLQLDEPWVRIPLAETQGDGAHLGLTLAAQGHVSFPFGSADRGTVFVGVNTIAIVDRLDYSDLFDPGWGFTLEIDLMARPEKPRAPQPPWSRSPEMGGYVAAEVDWFPGSSTRDDAGTRIRPETMRLPAIFVGFKAAGDVQDYFYGDIRAGLGAAHFPSLEANFTPANGLQQRGELFADTWTFAMELRMHFGWRLGPVGLVFGFGGRLIAPPDRGRDSNLDPDILWTVDFDLGAEIGF